MSPDGSSGAGRWFWGSYDEFGFDVTLTRSTGAPMLMSTDRPRLKAGAASQQIRIFGDSLPAQLTTTDIDFGAGIAVRRIVSRTASDGVCAWGDSAGYGTTLTSRAVPMPSPFPLRAEL